MKLIHRSSIQRFCEFAAAVAGKSAWFDEVRGGQFGLNRWLLKNARRIS
jgi:hypothetical protein